MESTSNYQSNISPIDALWALYQSQTKRVRKAFRQRIIAEENEDKANAQNAMLKDSMTRAFDELHSGLAKHDARKLFAK